MGEKKWILPSDALTGMFSILIFRQQLSSFNLFHFEKSKFWRENRGQLRSNNKFWPNFGPKNDQKAPKIFGGVR